MSASSSFVCGAYTCICSFRTCVVYPTIGASTERVDSKFQPQTSSCASFQLLFIFRSVLLTPADRTSGPYLVQESSWWLAWLFSVWCVSNEAIFRVNQTCILSSKGGLLKVLPQKPRPLAAHAHVAREAPSARARGSQAPCFRVNVPVRFRDYSWELRKPPELLFFSSGTVVMLILHTVWPHLRALQA